MRLLIGNPRCLIVVAPHADDETIGAYGLMARLRARGVEVRVVVVTDGSASHPGSHRWPRARLIRERQRETRRAMRHIGIAADAINFLGLPDGKLYTVPAIVNRCIGRALRRAPKPVLVLAPTLTDGHPDHRVVALGVAASHMTGARRLAYPIWPVGRRPGSGRFLPLTTQERLAKRRTISSYRTQVGMITDDPGGFALTPNQIAAFSGPNETFLEVRR